MQKDIEYLHLLRIYILIALGIFFLSVVFGYIISLMNPGLSENMLKEFKETFGWIINLNNPLAIMLFIFFNNALKSFAIMILGAVPGMILKKTLEFIGIWNYILVNYPLKYILTFVLEVFAIIPILFIAYNGSILGIVVDGVSRQKGTFFVMASLLPHGIIEISMILVCAAIGLRLGKIMMDSYLKGIHTDMRSELFRAISFYLKRIAPLLLVAAMIETFVTPVIAIQFLKI